MPLSMEKFLFSEFGRCKLGYHFILIVAPFGLILLISLKGKSGGTGLT